MEKLAEEKGGAYTDIYVTVTSTDINTNNIDKNWPYIISELDGTPHPFKPRVEPGKPQCDLCLRMFASFTEVFKHKGHLCTEDTTAIPNPHPVKVNFAKEQLVYIEDGLKALGKEIKENPDGSLYIVHDAQLLGLFSRQLYTCQVTKYNLEYWYPYVEKLNKLLARALTPNTVILPLLDEELKLLQSLAASALAEGVGMSRRLTNAELSGRDKLEDKIGGIMEKDKVYFPRLSTRSPKDGVSMKKEDENLDILSRLKKKYHLLQVTSPQQVVDLFSKSQRVFSDIGFYFQYRIAGSSSGQLCLILRDWIENLPMDHEFRCYVHKKKMLAISQYQCYLRFETLQNKEHILKVRKAILEFHDKIKDHLPWPDYVIDVVVYSDYSCGIIEMNPFGAAMSSGSALFNWEKDSDLFSGKLNLDTPPIRVLSQLVDEKNTKIN